MTTYAYAIVNTSTNMVDDTLFLDESDDPGVGHIKIQSDEAVVGWEYDPVSGHVKPPISDVMELLEGAYTNKLESGITYEGMQLSCNAATLASLAALYLQAINQAGTDVRVLINEDEETLDTTNSGIIEVYTLLTNLWQTATAAFQSIRSDVTNGNYLTLLTVEGDFAAAVTSTTVTRTALPDLRAAMTDMQDDLAAKVDKVTGKALSTNDYTSTEKSKLGGIATGATAYTDAMAIAAALTGLSTSSAATVVAADSIMAAIGKLQAQATANKARAVSSLTLALVGSGATGTRIHATKDSTVRANCSVSATANIGGPATSVVDMKVCATNSATESDWATVATLETDQTVTLALALNSVQLVKGQLSYDLPGGWYVKLVNSGTGTHAETFIRAQQTIIG